MQHHHAATAFIDALDGVLAQACCSTSWQVKVRLGSCEWTSRAGDASLPVCRFAEAALAAAPPLLAAPLAALMPALAWTQNPNYRRDPPDPRFLDNYGYAVIAGPAAGAAALAISEALALGVLLLGPHTHYPAHAHPAAEAYVPLNQAEWWRGEGPWTSQPAGAVIDHAPGVVHATRTGGQPLLAVYLWRGDLATPARLIPRRA